MQSLTCIFYIKQRKFKMSWGIHFFSQDFEQDDSMSYKQQKKQIIQLGDCLDLFTKEEQLGENDLWFV